MESQHPTLINLRRQIELLELDNATLRSEVGRLAVDHETDVENIRLILLDALSYDGSRYVSVQSLVNSVADVLGISLLKEIRVSIPLTVEATMLVPADFDVSELTLTDVGLDSDNTDVEDFNVQSWYVGDIQEI